MNAKQTRVATYGPAILFALAYFTGFLFSLVTGLCSPITTGLTGGLLALLASVIYIFKGGPLPYDN